MNQKSNKKGDIIDGLLFFGKEGADPIQFSDYPETVIETLRAFYGIWKIPSYIIPSKKSKSKFEEWINQLTDLNGICPNSKKMNRAMQIAKETYDGLQKQFMVVRPASIRTLIIDAVRRINDEKESDLKDTIIDPIEVKNAASSGEVKNELKSLMEDF